MTDRSVGFIGVGRMGGRLARRLVDAGYELTVCDTSREAVDKFVALGARRADTAAEAASAAEVVMVSLPTPGIVERVALGPDGISNGSRVKVFVDTSTTGSEYARRIAAGLAAHDITSVDAPVSGGLPGAEAGTLAVMLSCPEPVFERLKPMMELFGTPFLVGTEPGQGQTMKLLNNLLSATAMAISSEALVVGVKAGLDPVQMMEVINAGTGRNSATVVKIPKHVIPRTFDAGFAIGLLNKDVRLCLAEADALGVPMVVGTAVRQLLAITAASEGGDADMTEIVKTVERWAGIERGSR